MSLWFLLVHSTEDVNGYWEYDGGVLLTGDGAQGLEISAREAMSDENRAKSCYLSCMAAWLPAIVSLAALRATLAVFSPSAAIT